jgi:tRNA 2-thiocytidine biosynthesis protein TtcA
MKAMLKSWDKQFPGRLETIFTSLQNVAPSQLADTHLFDFAGLGQKPTVKDPEFAFDSMIEILSR